MKRNTYREEIKYSRGSNECYNKINSNKEDLEVLDKWINATRVKLKKNILIKQDKEEVNNRMYSAMHDILGPDVMKELDKVNEEEV